MTNVWFQENVPGDFFKTKKFRPDMQRSRRVQQWGVKFPCDILSNEYGATLPPSSSPVSPPSTSTHHTHKYQQKVLFAIHGGRLAVTVRMDDTEENLLLLFYFVGFVIAGILLYLTADILDRLMKARIEQDHSDRARVEYRAYEQGVRYGEMLV